MLRDLLHDQVDCSRSLPNDQNAGEPTDKGSAYGPRRAGAPVHFGHWGDYASSRLDHALDLEASQTKFSTAFRNVHSLSAELHAAEMSARQPMSSEDRPYLTVTHSSCETHILDCEHLHATGQAPMLRLCWRFSFDV